jgi:hypothetical protein
VFFTHEQIVRGAIVEGVVRGMDADSMARRKAKASLMFRKF